MARHSNFPEYSNVIATKMPHRASVTLTHPAAGVKRWDGSRRHACSPLPFAGEGLGVRGGPETAPSITLGRIAARSAALPLTPGPSPAMGEGRQQAVAISSAGCRRSRRGW